MTDDVLTRLLEIYENNPTTGNALLLGIMVGASIGWVARGKVDGDDNADVQINQAGNAGLSVSDVMSLLDRQERYDNANDLRALNERLRRMEETTLRMIASVAQDRAAFGKGDIDELPGRSTQPIYYEYEEDENHVQTKPTYQVDKRAVAAAIRRHRERTRDDE
jgi:hypothetical protein